MGLFKKMREITGAPAAELMRNGLLAQGIIVDIQQTNVSTGADFDPSHVCVFTVEVSLDNTPRYTATCRQAIRATLLPGLSVPGRSVAVRVDPGDHSHIALDLTTPPPVVTVSAEEGDSRTGSAAEILEHGVACRVVIVETMPLGRRNQEGVDLHAFVLTVMLDGRPPYQTRLGLPVPADALPLLYPGSRLPARCLPDRGEQYVMVDWPTALAEVTAGSPGG